MEVTINNYLVIVVINEGLMGLMDIMDLIDLMDIIFNFIRLTFQFIYIFCYDLNYNLNFQIKNFKKFKYDLLLKKLINKSLLYLINIFIKFKNK